MNNISGVHVWLVMWKAWRAMEKQAISSIEAGGLCQSDFGVLEALLHKGPLAVGALGEKVLLTSGSITTAVDRLEQRKLVERAFDPEDRRARIVHLTGTGRKLIQRMFSEHEQAMEQAVAVLQPRQRADLVELLKTLGKSLAKKDFDSKE